jgi:hypothetical protein
MISAAFSRAYHQEVLARWKTILLGAKSFSTQFAWSFHRVVEKKTQNPLFGPVRFAFLITA